MDKLQEKLDALGWTMEKLLVHLDMVVIKKAQKRESNRKYFEKNKEQIYDYHKGWRADHPEYRERKRELAKKTPEKSKKQEIMEQARSEQKLPWK